jgi:hypothetical protein
LEQVETGQRDQIQMEEAEQLAVEAEAAVADLFLKIIQLLQDKLIQLQ